VTNEEREKLLQIVEIVGDVDYHGGWINVPIHLLDGVADGAGMQHVELFFDATLALELVQSLLAALHVALADESKAAQSYTRQMRSKGTV
jgi:hypothetical protein